MSSFLISENHVYFFGLIFLRVIAFVFSSALFSSPNISTPLRVLFSLLLGFLVYSVQLSHFSQWSFAVDTLISSAIQELVLGLSLGAVTRFFFYAIGMAGDLISTSIGLNSGQVFNPMSGTQSNILEQFQTLLATLVFFALNGHHILITALAQSFDIVPLTAPTLKGDAFSGAMVLGGQLIELALKMAAPVVVSLFMVNLTMGILGRTVPQLNVLLTSLSVTMIIGFAVLFVTLPLMIYEMNSVVQMTGDSIFKMMRNF